MASFSKGSLLARVGAGGHGRRRDVYSSPIAGPSIFTQRGLSRMERHHQPKQKLNKQMLNIFHEIFLFFIIIFIFLKTLSFVGHRGGLQSDFLREFSPGNPPALLLHTRHGVTTLSVPRGAPPSPQHTEQRSSHGNYSSSSGLRRAALQEGAPAERMRFSPRQNAFPIPLPPPHTHTLSWWETACKTRSIPRGKVWKNSKSETAAFFKSHWSGVWWKVRSSP